MTNSTPATAARRGTVAYEPCYQDGHSHDWRDCPTPEDWVATEAAPDRWVILVVQGTSPSERFIGPFTRAEAETWVDQQVETGATWFRLVVAPLEAPDGT